MNEQAMSTYNITRYVSAPSSQRAATKKQNRSGQPKRQQTTLAVNSQLSGPRNDQIRSELVINEEPQSLLTELNLILPPAESYEAHCTALELNWPLADTGLWSPPAEPKQALRPATHSESVSTDADDNKPSNQNESESSQSSRFSILQLIASGGRLLNKTPQEQMSSFPTAVLGDSTRWRAFLSNRWKLLCRLLRRPQSHEDFLGAIVLEDQDMPERFPFSAILKIPRAWEARATPREESARRFSLLRLLLGRHLVRRFSKRGWALEALGIDHLPKLQRFWQRPLEALAEPVDTLADALGLYLALMVNPCSVKGESMEVPSDLQGLDASFDALLAVIRHLGEDGLELDASRPEREAARLVALLDRGGNSPCLPTSVLQTWEDANPQKPTSTLPGLLSLVERRLAGDRGVAGLISFLGLGPLVHRHKTELQSLPLSSGRCLLEALCLHVAVQSRLMAGSYNLSFESRCVCAIDLVFELLNEVPWEGQLDSRRDYPELFEPPYWSDMETYALDPAGIQQLAAQERARYKNQASDVRISKNITQMQR